MPEIPICAASPVQLPLKTLNSDIFSSNHRISIKIHRNGVQCVVFVWGMANGLRGGVAVILYI